MAFQNTNNLTILGPFEENEKISKIEELSDFSQFLKTYGTKEAKNLTIKDYLLDILVIIILLNLKQNNLEICINFIIINNLYISFLYLPNIHIDF